MPVRALITLLVLAVVIIAGCGDSEDAPQDTPAATEQPGPTPTPPASVQVRVRDLVIQAVSAVTAEERGQGLSGRESLAPDAGMLFFMTAERIPGFHMNDMLIPLDFLWISKSGTVIDVTENVPHPAANNGEVLSGISPSEPVMYVLEVNAGVIESWGLQIGDVVTFNPDILHVTGNPEATLPCESPTITEAVAADGNLLANGGFEEGAGSWCSLDSSAWGTPFSVSNAQAFAGDQSALLQLRSDDGGEVRVYGVNQEVASDAFPETLSAEYFVEHWEKGSAIQYLQAVVIVWDAANVPAEVAGVGNHQIRYILAGVDTQPTTISNARYVMVSEEQPRIGEWVRFERDVRQDFQDLWGSVPEGFDRIRVLFEVRWDDRTPDDGTSSADVYYDDLYFGTGD